MSELERVGISLEGRLLSAFDRLIAGRGYSNRSEAIRDLIREQLAGKELENPKARAVAAVLLVYDHHTASLSRRLMALQHSHFLKTISALHIHINPHDCLEVIVLRGKVREIAAMGDRILSLKGIKLGKVNLVAVEPGAH